MPRVAKSVTRALKSALPLFSRRSLSGLLLGEMVRSLTSASRTTGMLLPLLEMVCRLFAT
ncbi:hypothetical protein B1987_11070 [Mycobacterium kansasii]|nr:hypothetical protein B1987_11070 [Mycobacterium kansasii]